MIRPNSRGGMSQNRTQSQQYLEKENDEMAEDMRNKVSVLKQITLQISDEVRQQNKMLGQLDEDFDSGHNMLGATMRRLGLISKSGGYRFMCYLILFSLFVFLIMWYMIR